MRVFRPLPLMLVIGCAPQPSTVPLGGEEWVRPDRHVDRRPRGETSERLELTASSFVPPQVKVETARSPAKDVKAAEPAAAIGDVRFELRPLTVGTTVTVDGRLTLKASISMNLQGATSSQSIEFEAEQQLKARVAETRGDDVFVLDVEYVKSRSSFRMPGMDPEEDSSGAGKRYRVTARGSSFRVEPAGAALEADEDKQVQRDLAPVVGYWPIVKPRLPASIAAGWTYDVTDAELATLLASGPGARFSAGKLSFRGRDTKAPDRALFGCSMSVQFEKDGASVGSDLDGQCVVRPSDTRPLEMNLKGDLRAATPLPFGADSSVTGTVELEVKQTYAEP